jgi:hypothetical protein
MLVLKSRKKQTTRAQVRVRRRKTGDLNALWWGHCVQCASARGDKPARVGARERIQKGDDGSNLLSSQHAVWANPIALTASASVGALPSWK